MNATVRRLSIVVLFLTSVASQAWAGTSHFFVTARGFYPCQSSSAAPATTGVDNKPAWTLIDADNACLETDTVWLPENIVGSLINVVPVFTTTASSGNVCLASAFTVSRAGAIYKNNTGTQGSFQAISVPINQAPNTTYMQMIPTIQAYDQLAAQDCTGSLCTKSPAILMVGREQTGCGGDSVTPITFIGVDVQYQSN